MKKFSISERIRSFSHAFSGIASVFSREHNMWIHLFAAVCAILSGFYFNISITEWMMIIFAIGLVVAAELFNSAIEKIVDYISIDKNKAAGLIKDISAGAVLVCAFAAAIIGLIIFIPKLF